MQVRWKATADLPFNDTTDTWTGLSDGTATDLHGDGPDQRHPGYTFEVRATNTAGDGPAATAAATPALPPGIAVSPDSLQIRPGASATFTAALSTEPSGTVTVAVTSNDSDVTVDSASSSLTFTAANYATPQTVTVNMVANPDDGNATINLAASGGGYAGVTASVAVSLEPAPSFGTQTVADQTYSQDLAITTLNLPEATGGDTPLTYTLTPTPPAGLVFDAANRTLAGTPTAVQVATPYTYTVTDDNGDAASLTFNITITLPPAPDAPTGLAAVGSDTKVTLTWTDPGNTSITKYQLRYREGPTVPGTADWEDIPGSDDTTTTHQVSGPSQRIRIRVPDSRGERRRRERPLGNGDGKAVDRRPTAPRNHSQRGSGHQRQRPRHCLELEPRRFAMHHEFLHDRIQEKRCFRVERPRRN